MMWLTDSVTDQHRENWIWWLRRLSLPTGSGCLCTQWHCSRLCSRQMKVEVLNEADLAGARFVGFTSSFACQRSVASNAAGTICSPWETGRRKSRVGKEEAPKAVLITFCFHTSHLSLLKLFSRQFARSYWFLLSISVSTWKIQMAGRKVVLWVWSLSRFHGYLPQKHSYSLVLMSMTY